MDKLARSSQAGRQSGDANGDLDALSIDVGGGAHLRASKQR
jgi:hypothetical protein